MPISIKHLEGVDSTSSLQTDQPHPHQPSRHGPRLDLRTCLAQPCPLTAGRSRRAPRPGSSPGHLQDSKIKRHPESPHFAYPPLPQSLPSSAQKTPRAKAGLARQKNRAGARRSATRLERGCYLSSSILSVFLLFNPVF
jgi:hypothetical protein